MHLTYTFTAIALYLTTTTYAVPSGAMHHYHHRKYHHHRARNPSSMPMEASTSAFISSDLAKTLDDDQDPSVVYNYHLWDERRPFECTEKWMKKHRNVPDVPHHIPAYCHDKRPSLGHAIAKLTGCLPHFEHEGCVAIAKARYAKNPEDGCPGYFWFRHPRWDYSSHKSDRCPVPILPECQLEIDLFPATPYIVEHLGASDYCYSKKFYDKLLAHAAAGYMKKGGSGK